MLVTQFDKFVNRSTQEILGSEIEQENLEPMLSTDIVRDVSNVTGVKGNAEIYYRTGNVNLTPADIGALDTNNVYNGLDETSEGYVLDARQGKVLNESISGKLDKANVYNGLDETSEGYVLDARQGKVLNESISGKLDKANVYNGLDETSEGYVLDARQGKALADDVGALSSAMTYVVRGNKSIEAATIPVGAYVRLVGSTIAGRSDGIYTVATAIPVDTVIDGTYFNEAAPIPGGGLNALNASTIQRLSTSTIVPGGGGLATIPYPTGFNMTNTSIINQYLALDEAYYMYPSANTEYLANDGIHIKNSGGASGIIVIDIAKVWR